MDLASVCKHFHEYNEVCQKILRTFYELKDESGKPWWKFWKRNLDAAERNAQLRDLGEHMDFSFDDRLSYLYTVILQMIEEECLNSELVRLVLTNYNLQLQLYDTLENFPWRFYEYGPTSWNPLDNFELTIRALKSPMLKHAMPTALVRYGMCTLVPGRGIEERHLIPSLNEEIRFFWFQRRFALGLPKNRSMNPIFADLCRAVPKWWSPSPFPYHFSLSRWRQKRLWFIIWVFKAVQDRNPFYAKHLEMFFNTVPDPFVSGKELEEFLISLLCPVILRSEYMSPLVQNELQKIVSELLADYESLFSRDFRTSSGPRCLKHLCRVSIRNRRNATRILPEFVRLLGLEAPLADYVLGYSSPATREESPIVLEEVRCRMAQRLWQAALNIADWSLISRKELVAYEANLLKL